MKPHYKLMTDGSMVCLSHKYLCGVTQRMQQVIAKRGMSRNKFALHIGVDGQRLKNMMLGKTRAQTDILVQAVIVGGVDPVWLFTGRQLVQPNGESFETNQFVSNFRSLGKADQRLITDRKAVSAPAQASLH